MSGLDTHQNSISSSHSAPSSPMNSSNSRRYGFQFPPPLRLFHSPLSYLLENTGFLRTRSDPTETQSLIPATSTDVANDGGLSIATTSGDGNDSMNSINNGEVAIRIIGSGEGDRVGSDDEDVGAGATALGSLEGGAPVASGGDGSIENEGNNGNDTGDSSHQRYDIQQFARRLEQFLPFCLLLLVVFIRQHLQGFFVSIWITAVLFKSNDILKRQTALKGERKLSVLVGYSVLFLLHVASIYWWCQNEDLYRPLFMLPPKSTPPFWHAIFIILVNDTLVRQLAMSFKLVLLIYYKNGRGHNYRRQGQMLTLVEYTLLLYRALLAAPVWYSFFLNKEYGSLFSSLITGLYITFKLISVVAKVRSFMDAVKALSRREFQYGSYATAEQVNAAGDLCAICQEKMRTPILLRCKHVFCEDCVAEWLERERTCPLCRTLIRPADLRSYGDGSTSLFVQIY